MEYGQVGEKKTQILCNIISGFYNQSCGVFCMIKNVSLFDTIYVFQLQQRNKLDQRLNSPSY